MCINWKENTQIFNIHMYREFLLTSLWFPVFFQNFHKYHVPYNTKYEKMRHKKLGKKQNKYLWELKNNKGSFTGQWSIFKVV